MFITRSDTPPAPATSREAWKRSALLLVGHGSPRDGGANRALEGHARALRRRGLFADVRAGALHGSPPLSDAFGDLGAARVYVAPLFMCGGVYASRVVPRRLGLGGRITRVGGRRFYLCAPLGTAPGIGALVVDRALALARQRNMAPSSATLLLVGHGSAKDGNARRAAEVHAAWARRRNAFKCVRTAFLEEEPYLLDELPALSAPLIALGLFMAGDRHADGDVPRLLAAGAPQGSHYLGAIGTDAKIPDLILSQVASFDANFGP
ncbi:MAG: CbiX/SirB N-terminal domain-containing protein [Rhodospirillales bacterium]|nr:CbiX/SirB N-terminal domain-containing protein [Rhodospirillales bacterium]